MTTKRYSPVGNGPQKSTFTMCHGLGGKVVIWSGGGEVGELHVSLTCDAVINCCLDHFLNSWEPDFFMQQLLCPWGTSYTMSIALCWSEMGITVRVLPSIRFDSAFTVNSSLAWTNGPIRADFTLCDSPD